MSRAIRITALVSMILYGVYVLVGRFAVPFMVYFSGFLGRSFVAGNNSEGLTYYIVQTFFGSMFMLVFYLVYCILLINASKNRNEKIGLEISCLVLMGGAFPIVSLLRNIFGVYFINQILGLSSESLYVNSTMNTIGSMFGLLATIASILLVVSATISICRKKFVIPMEYAQGIGVNDEFTSVEMGGYYQ